MTVHRNCYGIVGENRSPSKWVCDMCSNDKNPQVSIVSLSPMSELDSSVLILLAIQMYALSC
jgi:hypothetical protein